MNTDIVHHSAVRIATEGLRGCYNEDKIYASPVNYPAYWARDTFWALPGVVAVGDREIARNCFRNFLAHQRTDGQIPRKISPYQDLLRYTLKLELRRRKPRAIYSGLYPFFSCVDGNALFVLAFCNYMHATGDSVLYKHMLPRVKKALEWYEGRLQDGLVVEYALGNWMDTVWKNGKVLSTNALYGAALLGFASLAREFGDAEEEVCARRKGDAFREKFSANFWNGGYFDDVLGSERRFDAAGNAIACHFGLASKEETRVIAAKMISLRSGRIFLPTVDPLHSYWGVNPVPRVFGMGDYHNGNSWLWIDALAARVVRLGGFPERAMEYWKDICRVIVRDGAIHETYFPDGSIYGRCYGKTVTPFAWNSGVFLSVAHEFA